MSSTSPLPPKVQNQIRGREKNDTFFIDRKEKKKKGRGKKERRERKQEKGKKEGRKERKEAKKGM